MENEQPKKNEFSSTPQKYAAHLPAAPITLGEALTGSVSVANTLKAALAQANELSRIADSLEKTNDLLAMIGGALSGILDILTHGRIEIQGEVTTYGGGQ
jgi:hypothetical protein